MSILKQSRYTLEVLIQGPNPDRPKCGVYLISHSPWDILKSFKHWTYDEGIDCSKTPLNTVMMKDGKPWMTVELTGDHWIVGPV